MKPAFSILLALISPLTAFSPELSLVNTRGCQRGTEMKVHFHGERLEDICEALFYEPGLSLSGIEVKDGKHAIAKLSIAADAALGEHSLRLRSPGGITELRSFWVGQFPSVAEKEPNPSFGEAQRVELNQTVEGSAGSEDDDYYVCSLKKGQRLSVEVEAMRLGRVMFDAYVAILDPKKFELAACDDTPLLRTDAYASIIAPEDGDYRILVHEAAYEGNENCQYRLHIGTFPRPTAVFPTGGKPGETIEFTFIGDPSRPMKQSITLPLLVSDPLPISPQHDGLFAPSPHWITVSPLDSSTETGTHTSPATATRSAGYTEKITVRFLWNPPGVSGPVTIDLPGDQSEILYELNASADAAVADWQVCVLAEADTPQGPVIVSSALTPLKVAEPYISMTLDLAATEQGKSTAMLAKIETLHPFEGKAAVELIGLPLGATCPPQSFTKDQTDLTFPITVAADAAVGKHNGVFCRVLIPENGSTILHQAAMGSTLRIDAAAAQTESKPAPNKPAEPQAKAKKPLSRLEQLRQKAK